MSASKKVLFYKTICIFHFYHGGPRPLHYNRCIKEKLRTIFLKHSLWWNIWNNIIFGIRKPEYKPCLRYHQFCGSVYQLKLIKSLLCIISEIRRIIIAYLTGLWDKLIKLIRKIHCVFDINANINKISLVCLD